MLAKILPAIALVILAVIGVMLWHNGTIGQILRPTIVVVQAKRELVPGQKLQTAFIRALEQPITTIRPGTVTFPHGTTTSQIERLMAKKTLATTFARGHVLMTGMLGESSGLVVLRTKKAISAGENLSLSNIAPATLDITPPSGAITFHNREAAILYMNKAFNLAAERDLVPGQVLTISDTAGGASKVFVIETKRDYTRGEHLGIDGLKSVQMSSSSIPPGAITFQTQSSADLFVTGADRFSLGQSVNAGRYLTADMISSQGGGDQAMSSDLPSTLPDLISYMKAYPDRTMFLPDHTYLGSKPTSGEKVDIWVETGRTSGAFGVIHLHRLQADVPVHVVYADKQTMQKALSGEDPTLLGLPANVITVPSEIVGASSAGQANALRSSRGLPANRRGVRLRRPAVPGARLVTANSWDISATGSNLHPVSVPGMTTSDPAAQAGNAVAGQDQAQRKFAWLIVRRDVRKAYEDARAQNQIAFFIDSSVNVADLLGNGTTCNRDNCDVDRKASHDMRAVAKITTPPKTNINATNQMKTDPLTVIKGVGPDLQKRLIANGYKTFADIAAWKDSDLPAIVIRLDISNNLAVYIRQQAKILASASNDAAKALGFDQAPTQ